VKTQDGWLLHAGDAYFAHDEVHAPKWRCPPGLAMFQNIVQIDGKTRIHNQKRLRELVREHGHQVQVICAHDTGEFTRAQASSAAG
jgi:glyoxylase-like metal-dependent hydrolase (beta-lactamase superfamily II)